MSRKRKVLTLEERVSVIKKSDSGKACRAIAAELGVGKTQIQTIMQERKEIMRLLVRHDSFHMDEAISASELAKKVNVLDAILWLKSGWDSVQPATIQKCHTLIE